MRTNILALFVIVGLSCADGAYAQNPYAELNRLRERYSSLKNYSAQITFKAYKGHTSNELSDMKNGRYEIGDDCFKLVMGQTILLKNKNYYLSIDDRFREIDISTTKGQAPTYGNFAKLDSILRKNDALSLQSLPDGNKMLTVNLKNSGDELEKITIRYKPAGELLSLTLFYRAKISLYGIDGDYKPRVEIEYSQQNFNPTYPEEYFSELKYVSIKNGVAQPQPAYKNYQIFDLL